MAKEKKNVYTGTGHRKTSVARVTLTPGTGKITVNGKDVHDYLPFEVLVMDLCQPLDVTNTREMFDVDAQVKGGGFSGQTGAIRLAITKALLEYDKDTKFILVDHHNRNNIGEVSLIIDHHEDEHEPDTDNCINEIDYKSSSFFNNIFHYFHSLINEM